MIAIACLRPELCYSILRRLISTCVLSCATNAISGIYSSIIFIRNIKQTNLTCIIIRRLQF